MRVMLWAWSALWTLGAPVVLAYLWRRGRKDPRYLQHLPERFGRYPGTMPGAVWVHAVSLGEVRSAVPLIRALLARGARIVITSAAPAGRAEAERVFAPEIAEKRLCAVWQPVETARAYRGFLRAFAPSYGLVMEVEIWPRMAFAARAAGVPLLMCNAQYPLRSLQRDSRAPLRFRQRAMAAFAGALVKSELQAGRFAQAGVRNIRVMGELRFDQPVPPALVQGGLAARGWLGAQARRVIAIASAIEGEDAIYLGAIRALRAHHAAEGLPLPLFVYVPRRPERFDEVAASLSDAGLRVLRRSDLEGRFDPADWGSAPQPPDIFLGDSLGEMYGYLAMADEVIVGGGFNPKGAHNIIEALVMGKPVVTGPHVHLIEYPFVEAQAAGLAATVADAGALAAHLIGVHRPPEDQIRAFVAAHSNATDRALAAIDELVPR